ncbi:hypothetical protein [Cohnella hongkongensis]|uniref:DUF927 domain-containing protein n=1 Tax=Cohnella hongkongensis TaxID=178337 RepID=A0ABV9F7Y6_9BACL
MDKNEIDIAIKEWMNSFSQMVENTGFVINEVGEFCRLGNQKQIPLSNFLFRPVEIIMKVSDSGIVEDYKYVFDGILKKEKILKPIAVLKSDLSKPNWIQEWDVFCKIYGSKKQNYSLLLDYIYQSEKGIPKRIEYDTIGWHRLEDKWFFLHSGGVIGGTQNNNVSTSNTQFFFNKDDAISAKESFLGSLDMLDICDHKLSYSLLSFLLTSIIATPLLDSKELSPNYLLWIVGRTGYGKTTLSNLFTKIYKKDNAARPDAHKTKTILPGLEEHKDCVFVIDDYGTSKTKQNEYSVINKVEDIIRNLSDRHYSSSNLSNGMVLVTGESFLPPDEKYESSKKRIIRLKMDNLFNRNDQDTYDVQKAEKYDQFKDRRFLPTSIMHYIEWLSVKLNSTFIDDYKREFDALRKVIGDKYGAHGRYTDSFAHQIIAFNFYMTYGKEQGFLTNDDFVKKCSYANQIFGDLLEDQHKSIFDINVELFLDALKELILEKVFIVAINIEELNLDHRIYGVVKKEEELVVLKLHWASVYNLIAKHLEKSHKLIGPKKLAKLLDENDLICFNDEGNNTTQYPAWFNGAKTLPRVINFNGKMIPDIIKVIKKNAEETASHKDLFLKKVGGKKWGDLFDFLD